VVRLAPELNGGSDAELAQLVDEALRSITEHLDASPTAVIDFDDGRAGTDAAARWLESVTRVDTALETIAERLKHVHARLLRWQSLAKPAQVLRGAWAGGGRRV